MEQVHFSLYENILLVSAGIGIFLEEVLPIVAVLTGVAALDQIGLTADNTFGPVMLYAGSCPATYHVNVVSIVSQYRCHCAVVLNTLTTLVIEDRIYIGLVHDGIPLLAGICVVNVVVNPLVGDVELLSQCGVLREVLSRKLLNDRNIIIAELDGEVDTASLTVVNGDLTLGLASRNGVEERIDITGVSSVGIGHDALVIELVNHTVHIHGTGANHTVGAEVVLCIADGLPAGEHHAVCVEDIGLAVDDGFAGRHVAHGCRLH